MRRKVLQFSSILACVAFVAVFYGLAISSTPTTEAVSAMDFNAGNIIDDAVFYDKSTMSVADIQNHLNRYMPVCDTWGTGAVGSGRSINGRSIPSWTSRADYARQKRAAGDSRYHDPPYVCVQNYYENPNTHENLYDTHNEIRPGMISAAQIIYDVAQEFNVNPQVLLVMLKKESYVWGDNWPLRYEYNTVMGYACPDTAPCNSKYFGFYNQMRMAAWQLNYYKSHIYSYNYRPYAVNNILYSPDASCGRKSVYLENIATTSLYIYTPYTPNDAALRAYPGTATCGSYGNRNFFMYFNEWFGSTHALRYVGMESPRYMTVIRDTTKYNPRTGQTEHVGAGAKIFFNTKISLSNTLYLRSDSDSNYLYKFEDLQDTTWDWFTMATPRYLSIKSDSSVVNINTRTALEKNTPIKYFDLKMYTPAGTMCLRSSKDPSYFCADFATLDEVNWEKTDLTYSRELKVPSNTPYIDPTTRNETSRTQSTSTLRFSKKVSLPDFGDCLFTDSNQNTCVLFNNTEEIVTMLDTPRVLQINQKTYKINNRTGAPDKSFMLDTSIVRTYVAKTYVRSSGFDLCIITEYDYNNNTGNCIKYSDTNETIQDVDPQSYVTNTSLYKYRINENVKNEDYYVIAGTKRTFVASSFIRQNNFGIKKCLLTEYDIEHNSNSCLFEEALDKEDL